jgi:putative flippase GtrA
MSSEFIRFLIGGGINTAVTYALFLALSSVTRTTVAYSITYIVGIGLSYAINVSMVFRRRPSLATAVVYPAVYGVQYLYGLLVLSILIDRYGVSKQVAMLVVIVTSIPLTFVLTRLLLRARALWDGDDAPR